MLSYGVVWLLALATASSASPISPARRDSSLIPTPPPACLALISNSTGVPGALSSNLTDPSSISNTTTTCLVSPSDLPGLIASMNGTDLSNLNLTSTYNCTTLTNSTSLSNSTDTPPSDTTSSLPPDTSTSTDSSAQPTDSSTQSTDSSAQSTDSSAQSTDSSAQSTDSSTQSTDSSAQPTATSSSDPPTSTSPASSPTDVGSSGIFDPATGQFSANTTDPQGRRRKRSFLGSWVPTFLHRRIAQPDLPAVAQQWQDLCLVSGGDIFTNQPCVNLAGIGGINALLSTGGVCDQQEIADQMIDFAKSPGVMNQPDLIAAAIAYRQHARNADDMGGSIMIPSTPYCTQPPRNQELVGIVNAQLPGVNPGLFGGPNTPVVAFGGDGTCPAGTTPDVSTCSCA